MVVSVGVVSVGVVSVGVVSEGITVCESEVVSTGTRGKYCNTGTSLSSMEIDEFAGDFGRISSILKIELELAAVTKKIIIAVMSN